jgi:hypothetical protein
MNSEHQTTIKKFGQALLPVAKRLLNEINQTAQATASHVARLADFGKARWRVRTLDQRAFEARVDLGRRMAELGIGDAQARERIAQRWESIRNLQAAGTRTRRAAAELESAEARLAQIELERNVPPPGAEAEYAAAMSAHDALRMHQNSVVLSRDAVRPANGHHAMRLAIGYLTVCLLLVAVGKAFQGNVEPEHQARPVDASEPKVPEQPGDSSPGDSNGLAPFVPAPGAQASTCFACNGTGQANCAQCLGTGKMQTCFQCNGAGTVMNQANNLLRLQCSLCNGTGRQNCTSCQYGKVVCFQCNGTGRH